MKKDYWKSLSKKKKFTPHKKPTKHKPKPTHHGRQEKRKDETLPAPNGQKEKRILTRREEQIMASTKHEDAPAQESSKEAPKKAQSALAKAVENLEALLKSNIAQIQNSGQLPESVQTALDDLKSKA